MLPHSKQRSGRPSTWRGSLPSKAWKDYVENTYLEGEWPGSGRLSMLVVVSHRSTSIFVVDSCGWWSIGLSIDRSGINLIWILIPTLGLLLYFDWRVGELIKLDLFTLYSISFSRCGFRFKSLIRKRSYLASIPFHFQGDGPSSLYPGRANVCLLPIQSIGVGCWWCWISGACIDCVESLL